MKTESTEAEPHQDTARARGKRETRERIVDAAARLLRADGLDGPSVARVMSEARLTHGGFYAHFGSRAELVAAAIGRAATSARRRYFEGLRGRRGAEWLKTAVRRYLARAHRDEAHEGCPYPALGQEVGRAGPAERRAFEAELRESARMFEAHWREAGVGDASDRALATLALCTGGIVLARAVEDPKLSDRILHAARALAVESVEQARPDRD